MVLVILRIDCLHFRITGVRAASLVIVDMYLLVSQLALGLVGRLHERVLVHLQRLVLLVGGARARCHGLVLVVTVLGPDFLALGTLVIFVWREVAHQFRVQLLLLPSTVCLLEARLLQRWFLFVRLYGQLVEDLVLGQVPVGL